MGNGASAEGDPEFNGYRVLGIQPDSPASPVGFVSFFDFVIAANGVRLDEADDTFTELITSHEDKPLTLVIYNIKNEETRGEHYYCNSLQ
jgi:hypothetical protein